MNKSASYSYFILSLIGVIVVGCIGAKLSADIWHQYEAVSFPTTTGRVYHSAVTVTHSSKGGAHYHINIFYDYQVDGRAYSGSTYRYGPSSPAAYATVAAHPVGSEVKVYYRASDPADSLLSPGVVGRDFFGLFALIPAGVFLMQAMSRVDAPGWLRIGNPVAGGVKVISQGGQIRVRLPQYTVAAWTVGTFCIGSIIALATVMLAGAQDPSTEPEEFAVAAVLAVTAAVWFWRRARLMSGVDDLVINEDARTVVLPQTFGRKQPLTLNFNAVRSVCLEAVRHRSKNGYYYTWAVSLELQDGTAPTERLSHRYSLIRSDSLAEWFRERLHLTEPVAQIDAFNNAFSLSRSVG